MIVYITLAIPLSNPSSLNKFSDGFLLIVPARFAEDGVSVVVVVEEEGGVSFPLAPPTEDVDGVGVDIEDDMTGTTTSYPTRPDVIAVLGCSNVRLSAELFFHPFPFCGVDLPL